MLFQKFRVASSVCFKVRLSAKLLIYGNDFLLRDANKTHFHNKGLALSLKV